MKSRTDSSCFNFEDAFYGTSTMGERGQLVIPAEARAELEMTPGDKILIMKYLKKNKQKKTQGHRQPLTVLKVVSING
jgi:AbrB family looped-hinge helix DNA binding protein